MKNKKKKMKLGRLQDLAACLGDFFLGYCGERARADLESSSERALAEYLGADRKRDFVLSVSGLLVQAFVYVPLELCKSNLSSEHGLGVAVYETVARKTKARIVNARLFCGTGRGFVDRKTFLSCMSTPILVGTGDD